MVPENVQEKINNILKNEYFSESEGDEVVIVPKEDGIFYAYVKSNKRGGVGQMVISGSDLSFLFGGSYLSPDQLLEKFKNGDRSTE
jgi:hypothetical protein